MSVSYSLWYNVFKKHCHTKAFEVQNDPTRSASLINLFELGRIVHFGAAGQIRTADLILTKKFAFILPCVRSCLYMPSGLCAIRIFVLSSLSSFYLVLGHLLEDLLEILFRILRQNRIPYGVLLQSGPTHLLNTPASVK